MYKNLKILFLVCILTGTVTINPVFALSKSKARIASIAAGSSVGLATAAGTLGAGYLGHKAGSEFCVNNGPLFTTGGAALGITSGLVTYFWMMKMLKKYTPEYILNDIKDILDDLNKNDPLKKQFTDQERIDYLNSTAVSLSSLEDLDSKLTNVIETLHKTREDSDALEHVSYIMLEAQAKLLKLAIKYLINTKQILILLNSAKSDPLAYKNISSDQELVNIAAAKYDRAWYLVLAKDDLNTRLKDLNNAKQIFESTHATLKNAYQQMYDEINTLINSIENRILILVTDRSYNAQLEIYEKYLNDQEKKALKERLIREQREHDQAMAEIQRKYENKLADLKTKFENDQARKQREIDKLTKDYEQKLQAARQNAASTYNNTYYAYNSSQRNRYKEDKCSICLDEFHDRDTVGILKCGHFFHKSCIEEALKKAGQKCPLCRAVTTKIDHTDTV